MLDKKQPYGEVMGKVEGAPGARYFQDGLYFNGKGEKVGGEFVKTPVAEKEEPPKTETVTVGIVTPEKVEESAKVEKNEPGKAPIDLSTIDKSTPAPQVQAACKQANIKYTTKPEALKAIQAYVVGALNDAE